VVLAAGPPRSSRVRLEMGQEQSATPEVLAAPIEEAGAATFKAEDVDSAGEEAEEPLAQLPLQQVVASPSEEAEEAPAQLPYPQEVLVQTLRAARAQDACIDDDGSEEHSADKVQKLLAGTWLGEKDEQYRIRLGSWKCERMDDRKSRHRALSMRLDAKRQIVTWGRHFYCDVVELSEDDGAISWYRVGDKKRRCQCVWTRAASEGDETTEEVEKD
ncbi:unnamed protein product, partial [Polarella glacialis]